uniref:Uncharacterized protein n=1 Tax=Rhizophora mucronata TaxID=61149 RepID=A0A2P2NY27_RHIMU
MTPLEKKTPKIMTRQHIYMHLRKNSSQQG